MARVALVSLALVVLVVGCSSPVTVATFNIRMFPEEGTDRRLVAERILSLDASVIAVQEIRDAWAMGAVLAEVSERSERDYHLLLGPCGGMGERITTGVVYDADTWELLEHVGYPNLQPEGACVQQPGTLGVLQDAQGKQLAVLSVHFSSLPRNFDERREQWGRLLERLNEIERRLAVPIVAMGDYNSTGFTSEPPEERPFVERVVNDAGHSLATVDLACSEYWRPRGDEGAYRPSLLDHIVTTGGTWETPVVRGLCERLGCKSTDPAQMDAEFFTVSDHCPVVMKGLLR